ncbi:proline-rich protein 22 [Heliangelus exortis]|uniref:proline-rich protein 22 n=1 Tax=Heliangelus exortis TaxID=472823 RepID=UPI003A8CF092
MAWIPVQHPQCGSRPPPALRFLQSYRLPKPFYPQGSANLYPHPRWVQHFPTAWAPPGWGAPQDPQVLTAPYLHQDLVLSENFYPQGSPNIYPLPRQVQFFPTTWAPTGGGAPQPPWGSPAGLQRSPGGCFLHPWVFHKATSTKVPPSDTSTLGSGTAALLGATPWGPGGCGTSLTWTAPRTLQGQQQPYHHQGREVVPAPPALPRSSLTCKHTREGNEEASGSVTSLGTLPGSDIPTGSDDISPTSDIPPSSHVPQTEELPPSPCAAPHSPAPENTAGDLALPEEVPLEEALRIFDCSLEAVEKVPSSSPQPGNLGNTDTATPPFDFSSLLLPEDLLTPDYSVPETRDAFLSIDEFIMGLEAQELWVDEGRDQQPPQPAGTKLGQKQGMSSLLTPPKKHKALAGSSGGAGGD